MRVGSGPQGAGMVQLRWMSVGVVEKGSGVGGIAASGRARWPISSKIFDEANIGVAIDSHFGKGRFRVELCLSPDWTFDSGLGRPGPAARFALGKRAGPAYARSQGEGCSSGFLACFFPACPLPCSLFDKRACCKGSTPAASLAFDVHVPTTGNEAKRCDRIWCTRRG